MKKYGILIMVLVVIVLVAVMVILYFNFYIPRRGEINVNTAPTNEIPVVAPIDLLKFETPTLVMNDIFNDYLPYITDSYIPELYKCIGLNNIKACDENISLLQVEDVKNTKVTFVSTTMAESCRNQSNLKQYLLTGNQENLNSITTENARKTAQAIKENNSSLCPGLEYPTCLLSFKISCMTREFLEKDEPLSEQMRRNILRYLTFINPELIAGYDEDSVDKSYVLKAYDLYGEYLCDLIYKISEVKPRVADGTIDITYCDQFDKDKNLLERWFYFRCMNFAQKEQNYCLEELKRLDLLKQSGNK